MAVILIADWVSFDSRITHCMQFKVLYCENSEILFLSLKHYLL